MPEALTFYFDPMCPYAYQTSLWIREVRRQRDLDITWRFFSLEEVNLVAGKRHPWERPWSFGFGQMRVGALIRRELGNDELDRWYAAVGNAFFYDGVKTHVPEVHARRSSARPGFDPTFVDRAVADESTLDRSARRAPGRGRPLRRARRADPRVRPAATRCTARSSCPRPTGDDAVALWELVRGMQRFPQLYELRHPKTTDDLVNVAEHFRTYLTTRDWQTVENPAP